jgi:urease accessory protein
MAHFCWPPGWRWLLPVLFLWVSQASAQAHSPVKGMGDFINGLLHPVTTLPHVLIILGLGLLAGRQPIRTLKLPLAIFLPLSAVALAFTATGWITAVYPPLLLSLALVLGACLALDWKPSAVATAVLFAAAAIGLGLDSGVETDAAIKRFKTLAGNWLSINVLIFDLAIYISLGAHRPWLRIALRIAGSWMMAIALMMLAFALKPTR